MRTELATLFSIHPSLAAAAAEQKALYSAEGLCMYTRVVQGMDEQR